MDYKTILGILAVIIGLVSYIPYFRDIFYGQTRPHIFSWLIWSLLEGTDFFAQLSRGGAAGAWVTGTTALLCLSVFIVSLSRGEKNITRTDKISFAGALLGLIFWLVTSNPLTAVILVSVTDFLGFVPTFRKSYYKPDQETTKLYSMSILKLTVSLFALGSFNPTTAIYPASLILTNAAFVTMTLIRRKTLSQKTNE